MNRAGEIRQDSHVPRQGLSRLQSGHERSWQEAWRGILGDGNGRGGPALSTQLRASVLDNEPCSFWQNDDADRVLPSALGDVA